MNSVTAYVEDRDVSLDKSPIKRDWMDFYEDKHPYRCLPVVLGNTIGWSISVNQDIEFMWDGVTDTTPNHIVISKGERYCSLGRGNATISFNLGVTFYSDDKVSLLVLPPANLFIDGVYPYTTIISPSVLKTPLPVAWRVTRPNQTIRIAAGTPLAQIIPISASTVDSTILTIKDGAELPDGTSEQIRSYGLAAMRLGQEGKFSNFYRNAVNEKGKRSGQHEVSKFNMYIIDTRVTND